MHTNENPLFYLAGPLFNKEQIKSCETIENLLDKHSIDYFAPRKGTSKEGPLLGKYSKMLQDPNINLSEKREMLKQRNDVANTILRANLDAIEKAPFMLANIDDRDSGTMFEIGFAVACGKPIISYSFHNFGSNIMIQQSVVRHVDTIDYAQQDELLSVIISLMSFTRSSNKSIDELRELLYKIKDNYLE
jgi:nucleoside 2-deoxyribosyltransferase